MNNCPICKSSIKHQEDILGYTIDCPKCGEYLLARQASDYFQGQELSDIQIANITGWLRENNLFQITPENINQLFSIPSPSFHEKADKFLQRIEKETNYAGEVFYHDPLWLSYSYSINDDEMEEILDYLEKCDRIKKTYDGRKNFYKISPDGWAHLEGLKKINPSSQQCFVAMWFDPGMQHIYHSAISPAIHSAGYLSHKVDQREHNDKIDDEIIAQIKKSRFVLADFTGHRGGVYFEAGFAKGLGLEVIWTCKEDDIENLHFDIRQFNCILWDEGDLKEFKKRIKNRIEAVIGVGSYQQTM
jgi:predicted RNA-binding Zn-ribbon protein involved in translation (DUF1610 family)